MCLKASKCNSCIKSMKHDNLENCDWDMEKKQRVLGFAMITDASFVLFKSSILWRKSWLSMTLLSTWSICVHSTKLGVSQWNCMGILLALAHWDQDKMATILQKTFPNSFSHVKLVYFYSNFTEICSCGVNNQSALLVNRTDSWINEPLSLNELRAILI